MDLHRFFVHHLLVSEMTYYVSSGTLNSTNSTQLSIIYRSIQFTQLYYICY